MATIATTPLVFVVGGQDAPDLKAELQKLTATFTNAYKQLDDKGVPAEEAALVQAQERGFELVLDRMWELLEAQTVSQEQAEAAIKDADAARALLWSQALVVDQTVALMLKRYRLRINKIVKASQIVS